MHDTGSSVSMHTTRLGVNTVVMQSHARQLLRTSDLRGDSYWPRGPYTRIDDSCQRKRRLSADSDFQVHAHADSGALNFQTFSVSRRKRLSSGGRALLQVLEFSTHGLRGEACRQAWWRHGTVSSQVCSVGWYHCHSERMIVLPVQARQPKWSEWPVIRVIHSSLIYSFTHWIWTDISEIVVGWSGY